MPEIIAFEYETNVKVGIEVQLYEDGDEFSAPSVMVTARHGNRTLPVPLDADQADQLARDIAEVAAELHARQLVPDFGGE